MESEVITMSAHCSKLSPLLPIREKQNFGDYLKELYPIYEKEIAEENFTFHGKPVKVFNELNFNLQHQTFEHLTTKGDKNRLYNSKRCERLSWIKDILKNVCSGCGDYRVFPDSKWKKTNRKRYIIWCVKEKYVIVLEEREKEVYIITAYCLLYKSKEEQLEKEYKKTLK